MQASHEKGEKLDAFVRELGGIDDTLATMENSLVENELKQIKRSTLQGFRTGPPLIPEDDLNDREDHVEQMGEATQEQRYREIERTMRAGPQPPLRTVIESSRAQRED